MKALFVATAIALAATGTALAQDLEAGATSFKKCMACHRVGEGVKSPAGPTLNGIDGRKAGTAEGWNYSDAVKNSGITWNADTFREYIKDPRGKIPGTRMIFAGIKPANEDKEKDEIANLWAYLKQYDASGKIKQ